MTKQTEALRMAIEAMELHGNQYPHMVKGYILDAIQACKEALEQPKQPKYLYVIMFDGHLNSVRLSQYSKLGENEFIFGKMEVFDE
jgi:hypothetical protein